MIGSSLLLPLLLNGAAAFAPMPSAPSSLRRYQSVETRMNQMFPNSPALDVVDEGDGSADPFDSYEPTDEQREIATRDVKIGSGCAVSEENGQLLQIQFTAKIVGGKFSANSKAFDVPSMVFKTGEDRCLPGLEEGIRGMKVGGSRRVRVPPNRGYGDNWYRGIVPPNSHLEFDCTLVQVAQSPGEEFSMKLEQFGVGRAVGSATFLLLAALAPLIEKKLGPLLEQISM